MRSWYNQDFKINPKLDKTDFIKSVTDELLKGEPTAPKSVVNYDLVSEQYWMYPRNFLYWWIWWNLKWEEFVIHVNQKSKGRHSTYGLWAKLKYVWNILRSYNKIARKIFDILGACNFCQHRAYQSFLIFVL